VRAEPAGLAPAHSAVDPEDARLVAGRHHHSTTDDHRTAAEARVVPLLDRGEEGIGVGMQDHRLL
jgi:hypothetical protein